MKLISILWLWGCLLISMSILYRHGINSDTIIGMLQGGAITTTLLCTMIFIKEDK